MILKLTLSLTAAYSIWLFKKIYFELSYVQQNDVYYALALNSWYYNSLIALASICMVIVIIDWGLSVNWKKIEKDFEDVGRDGDI